MSHMHERELVRHISSVREFRDADITLVQGNSHKAIRRCQSTKGQRVHLVIKVTTKPVPERSRELRAELEGAPLSFTFFLVGIAVIVVTEGAAAPIVIGLEASGTIAGSLETGLKLGRVSNAIRHPTSNQWLDAHHYKRFEFGLDAIQFSAAAKTLFEFGGAFRRVLTYKGPDQMEAAWNSTGEEARASLRDFRHSRVITARWVRSASFPRRLKPEVIRAALRTLAVRSTNEILHCAHAFSGMAEDVDSRRNR